MRDHAIRWWVTRAEFAVGLVASALTVAIALIDLNALLAPMFGTRLQTPASLVVIVVPVIVGLGGLAWMYRIAWPPEERAR